MDDHVKTDNVHGLRRVGEVVRELLPEIYKNRNYGKRMDKDVPKNS